MVEVTETVNSTLGNIYQNFMDSIPFWAQNFLNLFFWSLLIVIYSIFIWNFYRWIAKKDLLELNLRGKSSEFSQFTKGILYFIEYILILPLVIFIWFFVFTLFLILLTETLELQTILIISVSVVTAIRMTSYYKEDLARDLSKMVPFTLLAVAITQGIFSFEKVLNQLSEIPSFIQHIWIYLLFILSIEIVLRGLDMLLTAFGLYNTEEVEAKD